MYGEKLSVIVKIWSLSETCRDFRATHMQYKTDKYDSVLPLHCCYTMNPHSKKKLAATAIVVVRPPAR
jgi:hypothetical protein